MCVLLTIATPIPEVGGRKIYMWSLKISQSSVGIPALKLGYSVPCLRFIT